MTAFDSLYYTDCRPGQGLLGGAGFQFQATSPDVPAPATALVQRAALYEPPVPWMRARRPVADYPPSLAHCADGAVFATAAGRYLGIEANGTREGNQFTHAVVTVDADAYGLVRPAQLWGASWWATGPAPTTAIDPLPAPPQPGRWTADAVRERVAGAPAAEDGLCALVSALQRLAGPDRVPVLMVCADPSTAACWLAAATLLLPRARALRVSFKIFAADARGGRHDVVVLHPDWATGVTEHRDAATGRIVFDLANHRHGPVEVTPSARFWVGRFLAADPFDVADAVERAAGFAAVRRAAATDDAAQVEPDGDHDRLAAAVLHLGERLRSPEEAQHLAGWLSTVASATPTRDVRRLARAVLSAAPDDVVALRELHRSLPRGTAADLTAEVATGVLRAEVRDVLGAPGSAGIELVASYPPVPTAVPGTEGMTALLAAELDRARPEQVPGLLSLATRHRLRVDPPAGTLHRFARWWADRPDAVEHQPSWFLAREVLDSLRDELSARLRHSSPSATERAVERHWSSLLGPTVVYPGDPLDRCLSGLAYRDARAGERAGLLRRVLDRSTVDRGDAGAVAFRALFRYRAPDRHLDEVLDLVEAVGERGEALGPELGREIADVIERLGKEPTITALHLIRRVAAAGHALPPGTARWHEHDRRLTEALGALDGAGAAELGRVDKRLLAIRVDDVTSALLACSARDVYAVLLDLAPAMRGEILDLLRTRWPGLGAVPDSPEPARAVAVVFFVVDSRKADLAAERTRLRPVLATLAASLPRKGRQAVDQAYAPARLGEPWWNWLREVDGGGPAGVLGWATRPFRGRKD